MDSLSLALVTAIITIGSLLVYYIQASRLQILRASKQQSGGLQTKRTAAKPQKTNKDCFKHTSSVKANGSTSQQIASAAAESWSKTVEQNVKSAHIAKDEPQTTKKIIHSSNSSLASSNKSTSKAPKRKQDTLHNANASGPKQSISSNHKANGMLECEPALDMLDSATMLNVFDPTGEPSLKQSVDSMHLNNNAYDSEMRPVRRALDGEYSSEQLFSMIAASSLSRDEVELAIELLLNKTESGGSSWIKPKNDPLQRLRNQLRESESALTTEQQNHEQTRLRLNELKNYLLTERTSVNQLKEELSKARQGLGVVNLALEQARNDLSKQYRSHTQLKDESAQIIAKLEQEKVHLQSVLAEASVKQHNEASQLRSELEEKLGQVHSYELSYQTVAEKNAELEAKLRQTELQFEQLSVQKQHDDYEACAKISDIDADRMRLDKSLKDHMMRMKELAELNGVLEKSVKELQLVNERQEAVIQGLRDERHVNEAAMKRALHEMEHELGELRDKLSLTTAVPVPQADVSNKTGDPVQREQLLRGEIREIREGLARLLPELRHEDVQVRQEDWVQHYLSAVKQLAQTVEELKRDQSNKKASISNGKQTRQDTPDSLDASIDSSLLSATAADYHDVSARSKSPSPSNGRTSKASNRSHYDQANKLAETKLVEVSTKS